MNTSNTQARLRRLLQFPDGFVKWLERADAKNVGEAAQATHCPLSNYLSVHVEERVLVANNEVVGETGAPMAMTAWATCFVRRLDRAAKRNGQRTITRERALRLMRRIVREFGE